MAAGAAATARDVLFPQPEINLRNPDAQRFATISQTVV